MSLGRSRKRDHSRSKATVIEGDVVVDHGEGGGDFHGDGSGGVFGERHARHVGRIEGIKCLKDRREGEWSVRLATVQMFRTNRVYMKGLKRQKGLLV